MKAMEAITNLHADDVERAREFFRFLGLTEDGMNQGWVARFTSADSGACVQVVTRDATAPEDSVMSPPRSGRTGTPDTDTPRPPDN